MAPIRPSARIRAVLSTVVLKTTHPVTRRVKPATSVHNRFNCAYYLQEFTSSLRLYTYQNTYQTSVTEFYQSELPISELIAH